MGMEMRDQPAMMWEIGPRWARAISRRNRDGGLGGPDPDQDPDPDRNRSPQSPRFPSLTSFVAHLSLIYFCPVFPPLTSHLPTLTSASRIQTSGSRPQATTRRTAARS
jgi:hypothetical protein